MRIAFDLDGVVYDWEGTARFILRAEYARRGLPVPEMLYRTSSRWNEIADVIGEEMWGWLFSEGISLHGLFRNGHLLRGAMDGLQRISKKHDVVFVTARPRQAVHATIEWAAFMLKGVDYSGIHVLGAETPKDSVRFDRLVDDNPENLKPAYGILFDQPWNQGSHRFPRVTWGDLVELYA